ncbi:replication initiation protein [Solibacillus sp.]|uniref:replication initiation protein n=1 Tax=Solibacillus sp. TaxID=1909654 RepID=UPI003314A6EC
MKKNSKTLVKKSSYLAQRPMQLIDLNRGLNLRQQRFFNMAILAVDETGVSKFGRAEYEGIFKDDSNNFYTGEVRTDVHALGSLGMYEENDDEAVWTNVFLRVRYAKTTSEFIFEWSPLMMDHIRDVKRNFIQQDLEILAHFKNKYSFVWYDFFKSNHLQWKWRVSKEQLIDLLRLQDKESYLRNHSMLYKQCIEAPLEELNKFTEYRVTCEVIKKGRLVVAYEFKRYQEEDVEYTVSEKQINVLKEIVDRYGDIGMLAREISKFSTVEADAVPFLMDLLFDMQSYQRFIQVADSFTSESFKDIVALAIKKDNTFKAKMRDLAQKKADRPTIDDFLPQEPTPKKKAPFYNWLEERE